MEAQNVVIALIIGLLVLAVISAIFFPRLINVSINATEKLNQTVENILGGSSSDLKIDSKIYISQKLISVNNNNNNNI